MLPNSSQVLLYHQPIDMRKGINGLSVLVADALRLDPGDSSVYIFYNKNYNKLKLLYWERNGFCLLYKILAKEHFKIPKVLELRTITNDQPR